VISAVVVPLILLALALAPGLYEDWKAYRRQTRLPLPPARSTLAGLLGDRAARLRYRWMRWTTSSAARSRYSSARLPHAEHDVRRDTPPTALHSRG
jgi:hypothetical protein